MRRRPGLRVVLVATILTASSLAGGSSASANVLDWSQHTTATGPSARSGAAMAYDPATGDVVLFGGKSGNVALSDTWLWNGSTWTEVLLSTKPPPLFFASMAYDATTGNVVLFGGENGS